ncbi:Solute carrier family 22 member 6 [Nymphon striatum]|nr:Solute carrier family 22 member 6 [Nymphon striatum]
MHITSTFFFVCLFCIYFLFLSELAWDLVCDRAIILELMSRLYIGSTIAGYLIFGYIGDRFGRRKTILVSISGLIVCGFILAFSVNWVMFAITRFWIGLFLTGTELNCFVWMMESVNSKWRDIFGMISMMSWSIGLMYLNAVSYLLKDWTFIQVSITIPCLVSFFITIYALESPRWLMSVDRNEECIKTVNKIFEMNKRPLPEQDILLAQVHSVECSKKESKMFKCMNLFRRLQLRRNSIVIFFIGTNLSNVVYPHDELYSLDERTTPLFEESVHYLALVFCKIFFEFMNFPLMLTTDLVVDETFFNMTVTSALEVIGVIVATIELRRFGRKCPVFCNIMIGSILNFSIHVIPEQYAVNKVHRMTVAILGRIFLTSAGFQIIIYAIELLPTTFRTLGIGLLSMFSRLGVVLAEVFLSVDEATFPWASTFVKLCFCLVAAFISLLLPETKNHDLPSNIEELCQTQPRASSFCCNLNSDEDYTGRGHKEKMYITEMITRNPEFRVQSSKSRKPEIKEPVSREPEIKEPVSRDPESRAQCPESSVQNPESRESASSIERQEHNINILLNWTSKGIPINWERLTNLRFADDVVLFSEPPQELRLMVEELRTASNTVGLEINLKECRCTDEGFENCYCNTKKSLSESEKRENEILAISTSIDIIDDIDRILAVRINCIGCEDSETLQQKS